MKKRIIVSMMLVALSAPVFAQQTMYEGFYGFTPTLLSYLKKAVFEQAGGEKAEWVQAIEQEEAKLENNGPLGTSFHGFPARRFATQTAQKDRELFAKRKVMMARLLKNNSALHKYTFEVANPNDLVELSIGQFQFLHNFLCQPVYKKSFDMHYKPVVSHPKDAETQLEFNIEGKKIILLISSRPEVKSVFLFTNHVPNEQPKPSKPTAPRHTGRVINGHVHPSF